MKNFKFIAILFLVFFIFACSNYHKVRLKEIDHNAIYKIGIVKVTGSLPSLLGGDYLSEKVEALKNIRTKKICNVLSDVYKIKIDNNILFKTPKVKIEYNKNGVDEREPYIGNDVFKELNPINILNLFQFYKRERNSYPHYIDITYFFTTDEILPAPMDIKMYYEIKVYNGNEDIIHHRGVIAAVPIPRKGLFINSEKIWPIFISHASKISEALKRDIVNKNSLLTKKSTGR